VHSLDSSTPTIVVRPFHAMWEVFELPGIQPLFSTKERAINAARSLLKTRPGLIEIRDGNECVETVIDLRERPASRAA
jgi:hypothetical protein